MWIGECKVGAGVGIRRQGGRKGQVGGEMERSAAGAGRTGGRPPAAIEETVLRVSTCRRRSSFEVLLARGLVNGSLAPESLEHALAGRRALLVTTPTVAALYGDTVERLLRRATGTLHVAVLDVDERSKTLAAVDDLCERAARAGIDRCGVLVSLGGGVCSDLVTVAAQLVRRGVDHVRIPTTLVGQVDAGIGIKGAVNHLGRKSSIGVFHPPALVLLDPEALATLPSAFVSDGLAEMVKIAAVCDAGLFHRLARGVEDLCATSMQTSEAEELVVESVHAMLDQLEPNFYEEASLRRLADFGHTFSPILEGVNGFAGSHGAAVSVDIALSCALAVELGLLEEAGLRAIVSVLVRAGLPVTHPSLTPELGAAALAAAADHRGGVPNLVVPTSIGHGTFLRDTRAISRALPAALRRVAELPMPGGVMVSV